MQYATVCLTFVCLVGCVRYTAERSTIAASEKAIAEAEQLQSKNQFEAALPLLNECIESGGLNGDLLSVALVMRARSLIHEGRLEEAGVDLDRAEQGSAPFDQFHFARGLLLSKTGQPQHAAIEFAKARQYAVPKRKFDINGP